MNSPTPRSYVQTAQIGVHGLLNFKKKKVRMGRGREGANLGGVKGMN